MSEWSPFGCFFWNRLAAKPRLFCLERLDDLDDERWQERQNPDDQQQVRVEQGDAECAAEEPHSEDAVQKSCAEDERADRPHVAEQTEAEDVLSVFDGWINEADKS